MRKRNKNNKTDAVASVLFIILELLGTMRLPLMREVDFAKQKTEGEKMISLPQSACSADSPLVRGGHYARSIFLVWWVGYIDAL